MPLVYTALQLVPQSIPAGEEETVPEPLLLTLNVKSLGVGVVVDVGDTALPPAGSEML